MELEELQQEWRSIDRTEKQSVLSLNTIEEGINSKIKLFSYKLITLNILGILASAYFLLFCIAMFDLLEITYLKILAVICILFLSIIILLRIRNILFHKKGLQLTSNYAETINQIAQKNLKSQRSSVITAISSFLVLIFLLIISVKAYNEYNVLESPIFWLTTLPLSFAFVYFIRRWKHNQYDKTLADSKALIHLLNQ